MLKNIEEKKRLIGFIEDLLKTSLNSRISLSRNPMTKCRHDCYQIVDFILYDEYE